MSLADYMIEKPVLETARILLRAFVPDDVPSLREWMPDKSLYQYWGKNPGKTDKNPQLLFAMQEKPTKSFHWGIISKADEKAIGELWIYLIENDRMAKVAFRVSNEYHGCGYATEALSAAVDFCFTKTELRRIWSDVDVRNEASCRVLEKCGFTREGMIRQGKMVSTYCDYFVYGLLKEDLGNKNKEKGEKLMEQNFCQCCAMPMHNEGLYGTEADGSKNLDYCKYCYENGTFTFNGSMDEMIEFCVPHMLEANPDMTADKARTMMKDFFPSLKRWKNR